MQLVFSGDKSLMRTAGYLPNQEESQLTCFLSLRDGKLLFFFFLESHVNQLGKPFYMEGRFHAIKYVNYSVLKSNGQLIIQFWVQIPHDWHAHYFIANRMLSLESAMLKF